VFLSSGNGRRQRRELRWWRARVAIALVLATTHVAADDLDEPAVPTIDVHGFVSQGYLQTSSNDYLTQDSTRGSFEFTEVGLNFTSQLTDELRVGVQLFARDLGDLGNYEPQFDWYYLDYRFRDWFGIRAGRTKIPFGLYNETSDIDAARVPVLLPQSVYPIQNRDYLLAQTGGEVYGTLRLGGAGDVEYRAYGGTIHVESDSSDEIRNVTVPYVYGGRLMWLTPVQGLQMGGSAQRLRLDFDFVPPEESLAPLEAAGLLPPDFSGSVFARIRGLLWVASLEYQVADFLFATEYSRWHLELDSSLPVLVPHTKAINERYYAMASYRVTPWFSPGVYYSLMFPDADVRSGRAAYQHDLAITFRYDLNAHWLVKLEGHYMHGTAALSPAENAGQPIDTLSKDWGLLLVKTTAYF
jgi:hypothetical protein